MRRGSKVGISFERDEKGRAGGKPFPGVVLFWIDERVSTAVVKSVLLTASRTGFPNASFVVRLAKTPGRLGRLSTDGRVPGGAGLRREDSANPELVIRYRSENEVQLSWQQRGTPISGAKSVALSDLRPLVAKEWASHVEPDPKRDYDAAIVDIPNSAPFGTVVSVFDAVSEPKRLMVFKNGSRFTTTSFMPTFAVSASETKEFLASIPAQ